MPLKTDLRPADTRADLFAGPHRTQDTGATVATITTGVLMSCGARNFLRDEEHGLLQFDVSRGSSRSLWRVFVRVNGHDLYDVVLARYDRKEFRLYVVEERLDLQAADLGRAVLEVGDR